MDGTMRIERGSIAEFLDLILSQEPDKPPLATTLIINAFHYVFRRLAQFNPRGARQAQCRASLRSRRPALFDLFLDSDRQYSCAYFEHPTDARRRAAREETAHRGEARRSTGRVSRCSTSAPAGAGSRSISRDIAGAHVLGVTLSEEQLAVATSARARERELGRARAVSPRGLSRRRRARSTASSRSACSSMSASPITTVLRKLRDLLNERRRGAAAFDRPLRHAVADQPPGWRSTSSPAATSRRSRKFCPPFERSGLVVTDIEILRLHYAETLKAWRARFMARREEAVRALRRAVLPDVGVLSRFIRNVVPAPRLDGFQVQLARHQDAVPLTRDYIGPAEERLRAGRARTASTVPTGRRVIFFRRSPLSGHSQVRFCFLAPLRLCCEL